MKLKKANKVDHASITAISICNQNNPVYSIEDAIEKLGFGMFQTKIALIIGFAYMADYMEMMVLGILAPALSCDWNITNLEKALLTIVKHKCEFQILEIIQQE